MVNVDFPYQFDGRGRTGSTTDEDHIRHLVQQVLFTAPGERVNRPAFGSGLLQLVFEPNSSELVGATQHLVQGALQEWLGDLIQVESVAIESRDAVFQVSVQYVIRRTQTRRVDQFPGPEVGS